MSTLLLTAGLRAVGARHLASRRLERWTTAGPALAERSGVDGRDPGDAEDSVSNRGNASGLGVAADAHVGGCRFVGVELG
jgi:hypothetical protein